MLLQIYQSKRKKKKREKEREKKCNSAISFQYYFIQPHTSRTFFFVFFFQQLRKMQTNKNANQFYFQIIFFSFLYKFFLFILFVFSRLKLPILLDFRFNEWIFAYRTILFIVFGFWLTRVFIEKKNPLLRFLPKFLQGHIICDIFFSGAPAGYLIPNSYVFFFRTVIS